MKRCLPLNFRNLAKVFCLNIKTILVNFGPKLPSSNSHSHKGMRENVRVRMVCMGRGPLFQTRPGTEVRLGRTKIVHNP